MKTVRWEVEWCTELPKDEFGDTDYDRAKHSVAYFHSKEAACRKAAALIKSGVDVSGQVRIEEQHLTPMRSGQEEWRMHGESLHIIDPTGVPLEEHAK